MSFKHIIVILLVLISIKYVYSYDSSIDYTISEPYALLEYNDISKIYEKCISDSDIQDYISNLTIPKKDILRSESYDNLEINEIIF